MSETRETDMKRTLVISLALVIVFIAAAPFTAFADTGPKPSVTVNVKGLGTETCYGTLLSRYASNGPAQAYDGTNAAKNPGDDDYAIWQKFVGYKDGDGFSFLQETWLIGSDGSFEWGYYPPETFKILLYFPRTNTFAVSGVCSRYAFDSYYTVDLNGKNIASASTVVSLSASKTYNAGKETLSLLARMAATILIELAVALPFGFREKKQILFITAANIVTQLALNLSLNAIALRGGRAAMITCYFALELLVFAAEAAAYALLMPRFSRKHVRKSAAVCYALAANAASFVFGFALALLAPDII
jgi:hypothetical protein